MRNTLFTDKTKKILDQLATARSIDEIRDNFESLSSERGS